MNEIIEQIKTEIRERQTQEFNAVMENKIQLAMAIKDYVDGLKFCLRLLESDNIQLEFDQIIEEQA